MFNENLFISIIIPNYNHSKFLVQRIGSVLNQTYKNFEVIILDDSSTDNSKAIINTYRNNIHVSHILFNEKNSGNPFLQWQKGIELAQGEFIWIAESDDYAEPIFLEEVIKKFKANSKVGIVYCDSHVVKDREILENFYKNYRNKNFNTNRWSSDFTNEGKNEIINYLFFENTINNTSAMVFKKNLVDKNTFEDLFRFKYSGDWYFFLQIVYQCDIGYISKSLNYFRQGPDNFKRGVKSPLNYFRERSLVRYLAIKRFHYNDVQLSQVLRNLGNELRYQVFDLVKRKINLKELYNVCKELYYLDRKLFYKQFKHVIKKPQICKN